MSIRSGQRADRQLLENAVHVQSVRKSHPSLPIFMYALAGTVACSNGACLRLWGALSPLALWVINCNYSQTRKSGLASIAEDQRVRRAFRDILSRKTKAREGAVDQAPVVATVSEEGKREETQLVQHQQDQQQEQGSASNDFNFVQNPKAFKDLPALPSSSCDAEAGVKESSGLAGRTWFSTLLLFAPF